MLRGQDVHLEHFYYSNDFHRFWNRSYPDGIGLDLLQRLYPEYRLVILGDAHGLVDPHAVGQPRLRPDYLVMLRTWRQRLLLTPLPPNSWTYREGLLYSQFALFPADLRGQSEAAVFVESGLDSEDLPPTFSQWQAGQQQQRNEPTLNYRKWRTWADHQSYFRDQPGLQLWLKALAVYPTPTWEVTIAIGKALEPMGVKVNFDQLLLLSRIPWLQNSRFDPRLREEMLEQLDPQAEQLAREAVRSELEAVRGAAGRGHANITLETDLAVQQFALNPDDDSHQEAIRYLLASGLIDRRREAELNQVVERHTGYGDSIAVKGGGMKKMRSREDIHTFLEKEKETPPPQKKLFFTPMFWRAVGLSLLFVLIWLIVWFTDGSDTLYKIAFGEKNKAGIVDDASLRNYFFIKEAILIDSVLIYNNQGVDTALVHQDTAAAIYFQRAIAYRSGGVPENIQGKNYTLRLLNKQFMISSLVESNWGKVYYNAAVHDYLDFLNDSLDRAELPRIGALFEQAAAFDSVATDALHGLGLTWFYRDQRDSARRYYDLLVARTDSLFFDTISLLPNLETLLGLRQSRIVSVLIVDQGGDDIYVAVNYYLDFNQYAALDVELAGINEQRQLPRGLSPTVAKARFAGLQSDTLRLRAPTRLTSSISIDSLRVRLRAPKSLATVSERVIPFAKTWAAAVSPTSSSISIEGVIIDAASGQPIRGARVSWNISSSTVNTGKKITPRIPTRNVGVVSDNNGIFRITLEGSRPRTITLNISADQYESTREVISLDRLLKPGYSIALRPVAGSDEFANIPFSFTDNETGRPLTGVALSILDGTGRRIDINSGSQNRISQRLKVPASYTVTVTLPGYVEITDNVTITKETISEEYKLIKETKPLIITNYPILYFDLDAPARDGLSYNSLYQNYYNRKDEYMKDLLGNNVTQQSEQQIITEVTDFFEKRVRGGFEEFRLFHDQLVNVLENGGTVYLNIWGYGVATDNTQNTRTLVQRRIQVVKDYILQFDSNNLSRYVQQGRLVFQEENYGDASVSPKKVLTSINIMDQLKECRVEIRAAKSGR